MLDTAATARKDTNSAGASEAPSPIWACLDAGGLALVVWLAALVALAWALTHLSGGIGPARYVQDLV